MKRIISVLCLALLSGGAACGGGAPGATGQEHNHKHSHGAPAIAEAARYRVELFEDDQTLGGAAPLVTVVVFADYACPPCARTWSVLENLVADYGEDLQVVVRVLTRPGFSAGEQAAEAALAAGAQGAFWPMHRRLFAAMDFSRAALEGEAQALGLDVARFREDLDTGAFSGTRARHRREALELGIAFGPVAMVNGRAVVGFHPEAEWHGLIEEELALARAKIAAGAAREGLHAALVADGERAPIRLDEATQRLRDELLARAAAELAAEEAALFGGPELARDVRYQVALGGTTYGGAADAPVVIVAFMDPLCPFCKRSLQTSLAEALRRSPTELRVELRHLPLPIHAAAEGASRAAAAAGRQGRFREFYDELVAETGGELGRSRFAAIAARLGLDEARFLSDLEDPAVAAEVAADRELAGAYGLRATPTLFINGRHFSGHLPPERLLAVVDEELAAARELIAGGVERGAAAAALIGRGEPIPAAKTKASAPKNSLPEPIHE